MRVNKKNQVGSVLKKILKLLGHRGVYGLVHPLVSELSPKPL